MAHVAGVQGPYPDDRETPSYSQVSFQRPSPSSLSFLTATTLNMASTAGYQSHPFLNHLVALLSVYELGPSSTPIPRYDGSQDWYTTSILRSLEAMARRMFTAEDALKAIQASQNCGPDTKKRRSVGDSPPLSSSGSSVSSTDFTSLGNTTTKSQISAVQSPFFTPSSSLDSVSNTSEEDGKYDVAMLSSESEPTPSNRERAGSSGRNVNGGVRTPSPMTISLDGVVNPLEKTNRVFSHAMGSGPSSAPPTSHVEHVACPSCGKTITDSVFMAKIASLAGPPVSSPMVIPPGPLAAAAFESGMSAVEELRLLKAQVQDVAKVCNAVARGDLSQKITVPVQGPVMVQLKEVINAMVEKLGQFAKEVTRVSLEVGTEG